MGWGPLPGARSEQRRADLVQRLGRWRGCQSFFDGIAARLAETTVGRSDGPPPLATVGDKTADDPGPAGCPSCRCAQRLERVARAAVRAPQWRRRVIV